MRRSHVGRDEKKRRVLPDDRTFPPLTRPQQGRRRTELAGRCALAETQRALSGLPKTCTSADMTTRQDKRSGVGRRKFPQRSGMFLASCPGLVQQEGERREAGLPSVGPFCILGLGQAAFERAESEQRAKLRAHGGRANPAPLWLPTRPAGATTSCLFLRNSSARMKTDAALETSGPTEVHKGPRMRLFSSV